MKGLGVVILLGGVVGLLMAMGMDTSVSTYGMGGYSQVNNIGLMNDKQNYIMVSAVAIGAGLLMTLFGSSPDAAPSAGTGDTKCPFCAETIKREAIKCRFCGEAVEPVLAVEGEAVARDPRVSYLRMWLVLIASYHGRC